MGKTKNPASELSKWVLNEMSYLLGFEISGDIVKYILNTGNGEEVRDYLSNVLDMSNPKSQKFIEELLRRWIPNSEEERSIQQQQFQQKMTQQKNPQQQSKQKIQSLPPSTDPNTQHGQVEEAPNKAGVGSKKKPKFVPLYSQDGEQRTQIMLPGRTLCNCQAVKHKLVNNCLDCGRVVCEQEGSGPCFFCGTLVCSRDEEKILQMKNPRSEKLRRRLMRNTVQGDGHVDMTTLTDVAKLSLDEPLPVAKGDPPGTKISAPVDPGLEKAIQQKERLLEFDKTCVSRTKVIDDEADYFASDSRWLSQEERSHLKEKEETARTKRFDVRGSKTYTLDFAGRQVIEETDPNSEMYSQDFHLSMIEENRSNKMDRGVGINSPANLWTDSKDKDAILTFTPTERRQKKNYEEKSGFSRNEHVDGKSVRIQDRELQEMADDGLCLSMHQPWASLLVAGIKRIEGRTWYTPHRGRLWIAATAKQPESGEIHKIEHMYQVLRNDSYIKFPSQYPTGCLLGCVDVLDCLSQDEIVEKYPDNSESTSPYGMICKAPYQLTVKFPVKGKPKIWKLESHIHQAAKKGVKPSE